MTLLTYQHIGIILCTLWLLQAPGTCLLATPISTLAPKHIHPLEKSYQNDPNKQKSRQLLHDFIRDHLLKHLRPAQIHVLTFPGIDGLEIIEVYDRLGIPRKNITGIEQHPHIHETIRRTLPDIHMPPPCTLEQFAISESSFSFNVISLDYTGILKEADQRSLEEILRKNKDGMSVFHVANSARRDSHSQFKYREGAVFQEAQKALRGRSLKNYGDVMASMDPEKKEQTSFEMKEKAEALYFSLVLALTESKQLESINKVETFLKQAGLLKHLLTPEYLDTLEFNLGRPIKKDIHSFTEIYSNEARDGHHILRFLILYILHILEIELKPHLANHPDPNAFREFSDAFFRYFVSNGFENSHSVKYHYLSNTSAPMVGAMIHMERNANLQKAIRNTLDLLFPPVNLAKRKKSKSNPIKHGSVKWWNKLKPSLEAIHLNLYAKTATSHEYFEFREKSPDAKKRLTRQTAKKLFKADPSLTREALLDEYHMSEKLWTQLPAIKAHTTMAEQFGNQDTSKPQLTEDIAKDLVSQNPGITNTELLEHYYIPADIGRRLAGMKASARRKLNLKSA